MDRWILEEMMVFAGLMATLGCLTKIILSAMGRRKPMLKDGGLVVSRPEGTRRVYATAVEVERISEAQRFTTKLLVEKGHQSPAENARAKVVTPH